MTLHLRAVPAPADPTYDLVAERSAALVIRGYSTSFGMASRLLTATVLRGQLSAFSLELPPYRMLRRARAGIR